MALCACTNFFQGSPFFDGVYDEEELGVDKYDERDE